MYAPLKMVNSNMNTPQECACGCGSPVKPRSRFVKGHDRRGVAHTAEARAKMSASRKGRFTGKDSPSFGMKRSAESKAKMRAAKLGKSLTAEHKAKIGDAVRGEKHPNWQGGRKQSTDRYVIVWVDAAHSLFRMANRHGDGRFYIREHRLVMAESIGRALTRKEVVHHKLVCEGGSGDQKDNRIENLILFPDQAAHIRHHAALRAAG